MSYNTAPRDYDRLTSTVCKFCNCMNFPETEYREVEIVRDTDDIVIVEFALL